VVFEVLGAITLVAVTAAVTWIAAAHHFETDHPASAPQVTAETAAGAVVAAQDYFDLYGAGQYSAVYPMIAPADRAEIPEAVWTGLHHQCGPSSGLTYRVSHPVLSGTTAVLSVGFSGAAAATGSEQATFTYTAGRWFYVPANMQVYRGHDLAQAVAVAKTDGVCS
jgi:hypothetical protein